MKPAPFDYIAPRSLEEVLAVLGERGGDAKLLAGGQSLIPVLNFRLAQPATLIDLGKVPGLDGIGETAAGGLRLGALVRHRALERDPMIARAAPLLTEAAPNIAHPQIRNRGTVGGSLAHADPAAELPACAVALGAKLLLKKSAGERWVEASDFFTGLFSTALEPDEMVVAIELPRRESREGFAFLESARRHGDYAMAGVAARVTLDEQGRCRTARLVYLSVGDGPVLGRRAGESLLGSNLEDTHLDEAARLASTVDVEPLGDIHATPEFKRHLVGVLTGRALRTAIARARAAA